MCRVNLAQLRKPCCTLIKKLSIKNNGYYRNWQAGESKAKFQDLAQLGKTIFLALL